MSKYSKEELKNMATIAISNQGSQKFHALIWELCIRTGLTPNQVADRIESLAKG